MQDQRTKELARLEAERLDLTQQIETLSHRLEQNTIATAGFAPVNTIPEQVLMLILEEAYRHGHPGDSWPQLCKMEHPTVAAQVSRHWRNVAISLPSIWTCIHDSLHDYNIALFFTRSRGLPLQLVSASTTRTTDALVRIIQRDASRWRCMQFGGKECKSGFEFMRTMRTLELPNLEYIAFHSQGGSYWTGAALWIATGLHGPIFRNLKHLVMENIRLEWKLPTLPSLETLHIGPAQISVSQLQDLSHAFPNMVQLTLGAFEPTGWRNAVEQQLIVSFPSLRTLIIALCPWDEFISTFEAPQLREIYYIQGRIDIEPNDAAISSPRVYPLLTHMCLNACLMINTGHRSVDTTFQPFRQSPNLKSLEILDCGSWIMRQLFVWLRDTIDHERILLPVLETVTITNVGLDELEIVEEFCRRRSTHQPPLRELKLGAGTIETLGPELLHTLSQLVTISAIPDA